MKTQALLTALLLALSGSLFQLQSQSLLDRAKKKVADKAKEAAGKIADDKSKEAGKKETPEEAEQRRRAEMEAAGRVFQKG